MTTLSTEIVVLPVYGKAELGKINGLCISRRVSGAEAVIFPVQPTPILSELSDS